MVNKIYINRRERIGGVVYVAVLFAIGVTIACWFIFNRTNIEHVFSQKDHINMKMARQQEFRKEQQGSAAVCELLIGRIKEYDPSLNAIYEKNDIQFIINELRKKYEENNHDKRYTSFLHVGDFYQMLFNDKQHLWSLQTNLAYIQQNLEECELGLEKKREEIKTK